MPRNIEGECAVNVAGHVTYGVTVVARLRRRRHSIISERQRSPSSGIPRLEVERFGFSFPRDWKSRGVVARDILIRVRAPVSRRCRSATASCSIRRKEKVMKRLFVLPLVLFLAGASNVLAGRSLQLREGNHFATFKTYSGSRSRCRASHDLVDGQIKGAIDLELATKGLKHAEADTADLLIGYQAAVTTEKQHIVRHRLRLRSRLARWRLVRRWWHEHDDWNDLHDLRWQLALDMYVPAQKALVWRHGGQDARYQGEAGEAAEESRESRCRC